MNITIYTKDGCPNCITASKLLESKGLKYVEVDVEADNHLTQKFRFQFPDARQMPQIFIDGQRVGGLAGLQAALKQIEGQA